MTKKQTHPDLKKIISLGRKGIIYPDHIAHIPQVQLLKLSIFLDTDFLQNHVDAIA